MEYILIDNFNDTINIVCKDDGSGESLVFDTLLGAEEALNENCQNGQIIPLGVNLIKTISDLSEFMEQIEDEEGEENFDNKEIINTVDEILDRKS